MRHRVLLVGEAVTVAHVARPIALAKALDRRHYDVHIAFDPRYRHLTGQLPFSWHALRSIAPEMFMASLARGKRIYEFDTLSEYVADDLALIEKVQPDLVVGDFRLSMAVSARVAGVPYAALTNATWSPYARPQYAIPELPLTKIGLPIAQALFNAVRPFAFALHCCPFNRLQRQFGLKPSGYHLPEVYTEGDYTLYADTPALVPVFDAPLTHRYIGPVQWSPPVARPSWWHRWPEGRPCVYVALGSSGKGELISPILNALADLPVSVLVATGGRQPVTNAKNVWMAPYLSGKEAASVSDVVICNGGSPTTYQGLLAGVPVLGIPSNLDQHLNMSYVQQARLGRAVRSDQLSISAIKNAVTELLNSGYRDRAAEMRQQLASWDADEHFRSFVDQLLKHDNTAAFDREATQPATLVQAAG